ncbi:indolepyruvate ferredoxin oxidoreductase subunit alpha [Clostridium sp. AWRP]|uniref:indolepyruvate ferredoxin oxidoreductase subunit alpha n=1 Tax=Clostridium sp. AWRP TaxID=2212991 RepID=UPI000FDAD3D3|nr:indolepyruvate ferredoxin oxidoreductase subunit alpha [Clostridium sp. AWRP]AZV57674.1 indolepyruvate ferredoxin oxidoreductase subunit alpha [Clostridium sp. AWRP]
MKKLLTANEAVARGAYESGITYAAAYPGTPSTEIMENIATYKGDIIAEWAPNEKVALESVIGASIAGARTLASMKHVGVNVAADPLFTFAYTGVNGGMVLISADDPGLHSSQNEQDNRHYAKSSKIPMLEPSNSQESKDMVKVAMELSEKYDTPVMMRMTTRVCHSKSLVEIGERTEVLKKPYVKSLQKYDVVPAVSKVLHEKVEERLNKLEELSNKTPLNFIEWNDKKVGIISAGVAYQYAREVFGTNASYLKLGFTYPLPMEKIREFAKQVDTLYVIEELDPFMEEQIKAAGINCIGKGKIPITGELNPDIIAKVLLGKENKTISYDESILAKRPPVLCAGCPHRGFFYELSKRKNVMVSSDIGCYGLSNAAPLNAKDTSMCMGAGFSMAHGAQKVFNKFNDNMRVVAVLGDSTFFHSGMTSLLDAVYNRSNAVFCILDNRITGMTGHQQNPGTGFTLQGDPTNLTDVEAVVKALGVKKIKVINPLKLDEVKEALDWGLTQDEPAVIITKWPCVLKKPSQKDKDDFGDYKGLCSIDEEKCVGCKACMKTGCPALISDKNSKKVTIDKTQCVACELCVQVCPRNAISRVGE